MIDIRGARGLWVGVCLVGLSAGLGRAQRMALPEAPSAALAVQTAVAAGSVAGVVVDSTGAAVAGAQVTLTRVDGKRVRVVSSGAHGEFSLDGLAAGGFALTIRASGFSTYSSATMVLAEGQSLALTNLVLAVRADAEVDVYADQAEVEMKAEEKQRVLGVIPNYYVVYTPNPAPLSTKQKYSLAFRDTFDPVGFVGAAIGAGFEQAANTFPGYGNDSWSYAKRYAALYGDGLTSDLLTHAVFPSIFHQDPRYFYQGTGTLKSRIWHAVSFAVVTRNDMTGKRVPNYSYILGDLGSGGLSNLYYPHADRGVGLVFANAGLGVLGQAGGSLVEEFLLPYLTTHGPHKKKAAAADTPSSQ